MPNIDVLDRRRTGPIPSLEAYFERRDSEADQTILVDQRWSIYQICTRVRDHGPVGVLRLLCHGNASYIELGTGMRVPADTIPFQHLRGSWVGAYPRIEIHGCGVASSTDVGCEWRWRSLELACVPGTLDPNSPGGQLVQAIADNAGVLVIASVDVQRGARGFEGRIVHCRPRVSYAARDLIGTNRLPTGVREQWNIR